MDLLGPPKANGDEAQPFQKNDRYPNEATELDDEQFQLVLPELSSKQRSL